MIGTTLVTVGVVVAGVGVSAASGETLNKKAYLKAANAVCTTTNKSLSAVFGKTIGSNAQPSDAQVAAAIGEAVPIFRKGLDDIDALEGPSALDKKIGKVLAAYSDVLDKIEADPKGAFGKSDPFAKVDKLARKAGIKECVQSG